MKLRHGAPEEGGMSPQRIARVAKLADGWVRDGIHQALVVLVARRGVIVLHEAFGRLTPEPDSPRLQRGSIFPLASIAKPVIATAVMQLVEDGLLGLNRPVQEYLPAFQGAGKDAVMVHHLLTHTSGLRGEDLETHAAASHGTIEAPPPDATQHPAIHEYLFRRYDAPLWKPPGEEMYYCGYNYELLGEIVRRVSGTSTADFVKERITSPLGMDDTFLIVPDAVRSRIVLRPAGVPHALELEAFGGLNSRELQDRPWASAGLYGTALDLATFGQMFLNGGQYGGSRVLSGAAVTEMTRNQIPGIGAEIVGISWPEASWGYGWHIHGNTKSPYYDGNLHSPLAYDHGGSGASLVWVDPVYEIVGVYLSVTRKLIAGGFSEWCADLFMNAVTAAVMDASGHRPERDAVRVSPVSR